MRVGSRGLWVGTFHAISARLLRQWGEAVGLRKDFVIYDDDDQKRLLGARADRPQGARADVPGAPGAVGDRSRRRTRASRPASFQPGDYFDDVVGKAYQLYEERLAAANATDFGGLLLSALQLVRRATRRPRRRSPSASITCWSTSSRTPTACSTGWCAACRGAPAASPSSATRISRSTSWRGADIRNILDFERDHPGAQVVKLEQNYRSTGNILRAANAIIEKNTERRPKRLFTEAGEGEPHRAVRGRDRARRGRVRRQRASRTALSATLAPRDFAVFYRTNAQSRVLEDALRARDLPYASSAARASSIAPRSRT